MVTQGLMISAQAINHVAGPDGATPHNFHLPLGPDENLDMWAPWVRQSLYLSDALKRLEWVPGLPGGAAGVVVRYEHQTLNHDLVTLHRPSADLFRLQLKHMRSYADQRADRAPEVLSQVGFPTDYFAAILGLQGDPNRFTLELIAIAQVLTAHVTMVVKHHLACLRPDRRGAALMPMIPTPAHGSFPSAHSAEAFVVATVLSGLVDALAALPAAKRPYPGPPERLKKLLYKQAERIAVNRTVAGVHYPIDSWAGAALGEAVGQMVLALCRGGQVMPRSYNATDSDFLVTEFIPAVTGGGGNPAGHGLIRAATGVTLPTSPLYAWLWNKALDEHKH